MMPSSSFHPPGYPRDLFASGFLTCRRERASIQLHVVRYNWILENLKTTSLILTRLTKESAGATSNLAGADGQSMTKEPASVNALEKRDAGLRSLDHCE